MQQTSPRIEASEYADGKMLASHHDGIGLVTFNQPEKRNAISVEMWHGLGEILDEFSANPDIRIVVFTGAGTKAFVSGADISQFGERRNSAEAQKAYDEQTSKGRHKLQRFSKPTISMIRGFCLGGGLAIAMQTDLRIASEDSQFGIPAAKLGLAYGFEGLRRLVSLVGQANARMILYTAERINAQDAFRIGLINQVVASEHLESTVFSLAETIAANAPLSVAASKMAIDQVMLDPDARDLRALAEVTAACFDSEDFREGRAAFLEKRAPVFKGR